MNSEDIPKLKSKLMASLTRQMRFAADGEREAMARFITTELPGFVNRHFGAGLHSVWDCPTASQWEEWRTLTAPNPAAKAENDAADSRFGKAMMLLAGFLRSKYYQTDNAVLPKRPKGRKTEYVEGAVVQQTVDKRERDPNVRQACIDRYGSRCAVCGFDFNAVYGPVGAGYIEVHHLLPISLTDSEHEVNPDDLRPLCANCHAMAHRRRPEPFSIDELKQLMANAARQSRNIL